MTQVKVIIEIHPDGYVAYLLGLKGVVVGEGDTYAEALTDVKSAIAFHIEMFGADVFEDESPIPGRLPAIGVAKGARGRMPPHNGL